MNRRPDQVASLLRTAVQEVLARGFQDPRIRGLITLTDITVSADLKSATIMVSIMPQERQDLTLHGLRAASRHIRHQISEKLDLRYTPDLYFKLDASLKKQAGVYEALAKVAQERLAKGEQGSNAQADDATLPGPGPEKSSPDTQEEAAQ